MLPVFDLFFWPMRKMDARDGRRGDDLCRDMDVPYGEFGCLSFSRVDFIDSGPVLVFARRLCTRLWCHDSAVTFAELSVLADMDVVEGGTGDSDGGCGFSA